MATTDRQKPLRGLEGLAKRALGLPGARFADKGRERV